MGRRQFLKFIAASGTVGLLAACDGMPDSAIAPWKGPDASLVEVRLRLLSWALLAPNPHNLQAWLADLRTPGEIQLLVDTTRLLPHTDPFNRQVLIGCGAFLELLRMAASHAALRAEIEPMPQGAYAAAGVDKRPFARVRLVSDSSARLDSLWSAVRDRRTNRTPYRNAPPSEGAFADLAVAAATTGIVLGSSTEPGQVSRINAMAMDGYRIEFGNTQTWQESARALRIGTAEVLAEPSGTALLGAEVWLGRTTGVLHRAALLDPKGIGPKRALEALSTVFSTGTSAWVWLSSADNSRAAQIEAGRSYMRLCLRATQLGLAMHPNSQVLQEFEEMQGLLRQVHAELGVSDPGRIQMLARIGFAPQVDASPRRSANRLLLT